MSQRDHNRAGQRRRVHQVGAAQALRVGQRIDQDQSPFGVGVQNFDGLARKRSDDIARPLGFAPDHVFDGGNERGHGDGRFQLRDCAHGAENRGAAGHVVLHFFHAVGGLDGYAAGVKGDALADQPQVILEDGGAAGR